MRLTCTTNIQINRVHLESSKRDNEPSVKPGMIPRRIIDPHRSRSKKSGDIESTGEKNKTTRIAGMRMRYGNKNITGGLGFFSVGGICKECGRWRVSLQNVNSPNLTAQMTLFWEIELLFLFLVLRSMG